MPREFETREKKARPVTTSDRERLKKMRYYETRPDEDPEQMDTEDDVTSLASRDPARYTRPLSVGLSSYDSSRGSSLLSEWEQNYVDEMGFREMIRTETYKLRNRRAEETYRTHPPSEQSSEDEI